MLHASYPTHTHACKPWGTAYGDAASSNLQGWQCMLRKLRLQVGKACCFEWSAEAVFHSLLVVAQPVVLCA